MTGRGAGWCTGDAGREADYPAGMPTYGMGFGRGRGFGGGWRRGGGRGGWWRFGGYSAPYAYPGAYGPPDPAAEKQALANQSRALQAELDWIRKRLAEIESEPAAEPSCRGRLPPPGRTVSRRAVRPNTSRSTHTGQPA